MSIILYKGQVATIVMEYNNNVFAVDFSDNDGTTYAVETISGNQLHCCKLQLILYI
ncbi:MAG: DUF4926 domain-containing protein [Okeania sp. SIO3I5]|uniref:DUF4926 domain-containing protein n=1 Tax=Okeania sp. SIO3I5 TaxID=2607805 RepID=UPI0013B622D6|nr:DUF4926 domain-containing protein [Okeania sp. SIO3I5]NEQ41121.1 DUF4926 domain-containing protein [Okeania sp. SIO3I5]